MARPTSPCERPTREQRSPGARLRRVSRVVRRRMGPSPSAVRHRLSSSTAGASIATSTLALRGSSRRKSASSPGWRSAVRSEAVSRTSAGSSILGVRAAVAPAGSRLGAAAPRLRRAPGAWQDARRSRRRRREPDRRRRGSTRGAGMRVTRRSVTLGAAGREHAPSTLPALPHADRGRVRRRVRVPQLRTRPSPPGSSASRAPGASGGEAMAAAARAAAPLPRGARRRARHARGAVRGDRGRSAAPPARARWLLLLAHRRDPRPRGRTTGSRWSGWTRTATSTRPRRLRRATPGACRCGWRSTRAASRPADVALVGARDLDPPEQAYRRASTASTTTSTVRSTARLPSTSRSTSTCSSRAPRRLHARSRAARGDETSSESSARSSARSHVAGLGHHGPAPRRRPCAPGRFASLAGL